MAFDELDLANLVDPIREESQEETHEELSEEGFSSFGFGCLRFPRQQQEDRDDLISKAICAAVAECDFSVARLEYAVNKGLFLNVCGHGDTGSILEQ